MFLLCIMIQMTYEIRRVEDFIGNLEEKTAAKVRGQIWDGPIAQNDPYVMFLLCTKFHAFMIKWTIHPKNATNPLY